MSLPRDIDATKRPSARAPRLDGGRPVAVISRCRHGLSGGLRAQSLGREPAPARVDVLAHAGLDARLAHLYQVYVALLEIRRGNGLLADDHLKHAIAADPTFVPAYVQLADLYRARNDAAHAEEVLRQAVARSPDSALGRYSLGLSLVRQRHLDTALDELRRATELEPETARYGYVYAVALEQSGRWQEALRTLDGVLARHPYDASALQAGAVWAMQRGEAQTALGYLMTLRALRPGDRAIEQEIDRLQRTASPR